MTAVEALAAQLTERQRQIAERAATTTLGAKQLAAEFNVSTLTMKNHLGEIYARLGVDGRIGLVLWYWRR